MVSIEGTLSMTWKTLYAALFPAAKVSMSFPLWWQDAKDEASPILAIKSLGSSRQTTLLSIKSWTGAKCFRGINAQRRRWSGTWNVMKIHELYSRLWQFSGAITIHPASTIEANDQTLESVRTKHDTRINHAQALLCCALRTSSLKPNKTPEVGDRTPYKRARVVHEDVLH